MDIIPLLSSFTDSSLPPKCSLLWLEMVKSHGNLSKEDMNIFIKYLDNELKKYKTSDTRPLLLLNSLVNSCAASVFVENCLSWMAKLSKIIQVNENEVIISLACEVVITIIPFIVQNSELNRQFCNSAFSNLVSILLSKDKINVHKLRCLKEVMKTFCGPCRQFQKEIENLIISTFLTIDNERLQREAAKCLVVLPIISPESEICWNEWFKKLLATIHEVLTEIFELVEGGDPIWKSSYTAKLSFPLISNYQPIRHFQALQQRFNLLCYCISEMLSVDYSSILKIPVKDIIGFVTRVLIVTPFSMKCVTSDDLMLVGALPLFHEAVFKALHSLIATCKKTLIPDSSTISEFIMRGLKWTSATHTEASDGKSFSDLRCQIYSTLKLWAETMTTSSGLRKNSSELYKHFINDMRNRDKKIQLENKTEERNCKKRKWSQVLNAIGSVGPIKENPLSNHNICMNCLKALKAVHFAIGSAIHPATYKEICEFAIYLISDIQKSISNRPTPYDDPKCRQALYDVVLAFTLAYPLEAGSCLQHSLKVFSSGRQDPYQKISGFCVEAQAICQQLIHPRLPSLFFDMELIPMQSTKNNEDENVVENDISHDISIDAATDTGDLNEENVHDKTESNVEMIEKIERNGIETEENQEIPEKSEDGIHKNKRSKIMSDLNEEAAKRNENISADININDDVSVEVVDISPLHENNSTDELEEKSVSDSDIEIVSFPTNESNASQLQNENKKTETCNKISAKAEGNNVSDLPSSEVTEVNLTVEEMLLDFVSEDPEM